MALHLEHLRTGTGRRAQSRPHLIWRPFLAAEMGVEYLRGAHYLRNRANETADRIQFSIKYDLIY